MCVNSNPSGASGCELKQIEIVKIYTIKVHETKQLQIIFTESGEFTFIFSKRVVRQQYRAPPENIRNMNSEARIKPNRIAMHTAFKDQRNIKETRITEIWLE